MAERRVSVTFRLSVKAVDWLNRLAYDASDPAHHVSRTTVIRAALIVARRHEAEVKKMLTDLRGMKEQA